MRSSPELHEWAASERRRLIETRASMLTDMAGIVVMLGLAPLAVVMVLAGMRGQ